TANDTSRCSYDGGLLADAGACDPVPGLTYAVDWSAGDDSSTGSHTAGGSVAGRCAFKSITHALDVIGPNPQPRTTLALFGPADPYGLFERFPIQLPHDVTILGNDHYLLVPSPVVAGVIVGPQTTIANFAVTCTSHSSTGISAGGTASLTLI